MPVYDDIAWEKIPNQQNAFMTTAVQEYIMYGNHPGDFLRCFLCNDLKGAAQHADDVNGPLLFEWVKWFYNQAPYECWGSSRRFYDWIQKGGIHGRMTQDETAKSTVPEETVGYPATESPAEEP